MDILVSKYDINTWCNYFKDKGILINLDSLLESYRLSKKELRIAKKNEPGNDSLLRSINLDINNLESLVINSIEYLESPYLSVMEFLKNSDTRVVRVYSDYTVSETYRLYSSKPCLTNLKKEHRVHIVPREGYKFLSIDFKHQEPWILINLLEDKELLLILEKYEDFYEGLLNKFNVSYNKENRNVMKNLWNGIVYGLKRHNIDEKDAWIDDFFKWINENKKVLSLRNKVEKNLKNDKSIYSIFGLSRFIPYNGKQSVNTGFNSIFQISGSGILYAALKSIKSTVTNNTSYHDISISHTMHDEFILEIPMSYRECDISEFVNSLDFKIEGWTEPRISYEVGMNWRDCK